MENYSPLQWFPIPGYEGRYSINILGTVRADERLTTVGKHKRLIKKHYLKSRLNNCGYPEIRLFKDGQCKVHFIHSILAKIFLPNPLNLKEINHVDANKLNYSLENLEYCTRSQNMAHAYKLNLINSPIKEVLDNCSGDKYKSAKEAAKSCGIPYSTLKGYLNGYRRNPTCLQYAA